MSYWNARGIFEETFSNSDFRGSQQDTYLKLLVGPTTFDQIDQAVDTGSVRQKWDKKHPFSFERCPTPTPEPISIIVMSNSRFKMVVRASNPDFEFMP